MRKVLSVVLSLLMVFNLGIISVQADDFDAVAAVSSETAQPGDKVEVYFSIDAPDGIKTLSFLDFEFDSNVLTLVEDECEWLADGLLKDIDFAKNASIITFTDNTVLSGNVFKLVFAVAEDAELTSYAVSSNVLATRMISGVETNINIEITAGEITVGSTVTPLGDFEYELGEDGIIILGYIGSSEAVEIGESYEIDGTSYDVVEIAESAFEGNEYITSVIIPATVKTIGDYAFYDCISLTSVTVLSKDAEIGEIALGFYYISRREDGIVEGFTIYGYEGSTAEEYAAAEDEITFVALEEEVECEHDYVRKETTAATCSKTGVMTYTCSLCGDSYESVIGIDSDNHENVVVVNGTDPDCVNTGLTEGKYCSVCGTVTVKQETIDALGHTEATREENRVEATCKDNGSYDLVTFCIVCNEVISTETKVIFATGEHVFATGEHVFATEVERVESTCTTAGYVIMACGCGTEEKTELGLDADNHENLLYSETVAPTCTEKGLKIFECSACSASAREEIPVDPDNHTDIVADNAVDATCDKPGLTEGSHCGACNTVIVEQTETETIPHTEIMIPAVPADCANSGLTEGVKCEVCGEVIVAQETVEPIGHAYVVISAVYDENKVGVISYQCRDCGFEKTETVSFNFTTTTLLIKRAELMLSESVLTSAERANIEKALKELNAFLDKYVVFDNCGNVVENNIPLEDESVVTEYHSLITNLENAVNGRSEIFYLVDFLAVFISLIKRALNFIYAVLDFFWAFV